MGARAGKDTVRILYNEMISIYSGSPKYILPVAQSMSIIPVSPYAPCHLPPAKLNGGGGGEKWVFMPPWPPNASLSSVNWHLQVLLQLHLSTVYSKIDCMYIDRETLIIDARV